MSSTASTTLQLTTDRPLSTGTPRGTTRWWWVLLIAVIPTAVWARALVLEYGYRDDYSIVREVIEEPGKIIAVCMSEGRLFYGILLEASFSIVNGVPALAVWRLLGALLLGLCGAWLARILVTRFEWPALAAATTGVLLALLPSAQLIAAWASYWPQALAGLLGMAAFELGDRGMTATGAARRLSFFGAFVLMVVAALTYQSNALLYIVPLAAGWLTGPGAAQDQAGRAPRHWRWVGGHLAIVAVALTCAFALSVVSFELFGFLQSRRFVVERHPIAKLSWFLQVPFREALSLYVLRDAFGRTEPWYTVMQMLTATAAGAALFLRTSPRAAAVRAAGLALLLAAAYAVSFAATERWPTYRTIWPLSGVLLAAAAAGVRGCTFAIGAPRPSRLLRSVAAGVLVAAVAWSSAWNVEWLLARPQAAEWAGVLRIAADVDPRRQERVFLLLPRPGDANTSIRHLDEFGSLSADGDWVAKEMFTQALRVTHPRVPRTASRFIWQSGYTLPRTAVARVFDLRRIVPAPARLGDDAAHN